MSNKGYPEVRHTDVRKVMIKNIGQEVYLYVTQDEDKYRLDTRVREGKHDGELVFCLYSYQAAEPGKNEMVLLVHEKTRKCLKIIHEKRLEIYDIEDEDLTKLSDADQRFFYVNTQDEGYVKLEATKDHTQHYLAIDSNMVRVKEDDDQSKPGDLSFHLENVSND